MQAIYLVKHNLYIAHYLNNLLRLQTISLVQFKNYRQQKFHFDQRIIGVCGRNGIGKTNLLDAIYYLCFTKSYFNRSDSQNASSGTTGFRLEGRFLNHGETADAVCILRETGRKEFTLNDSAYERFAGHIGKFPAVMVAPDDVQIITGGSEERRRFVDALLSQIDPEYLQRLINYNRILQQRNGCLKSMAENKIRGPQLLEVYNNQLIPEGEFIFERRKQLLADVIALTMQFYDEIASSSESVTVQYQSQLADNRLEKLLEESKDKDLYLQRTTTGIHKDDLIFTLKADPFKVIASQGQRKSLLFALKLAEFEQLKIKKGFAPLLLLDDVFEKLDEKRMHNLLDRVCLNNDGQIFITDTHQNRIVDHFAKLDVNYQLINL